MEELYNDMKGQPWKILRRLERKIQEEMDLKSPAGNNNVRPQQHPNAKTAGFTSLDYGQLHTMKIIVQGAIGCRAKEHPEEVDISL